MMGPDIDEEPRLPPLKQTQEHQILPLLPVTQAPVRVQNSFEFAQQPDYEKGRYTTNEVGQVENFPLR